MSEDMENIETTNDELEKFKKKYEVTWLQEIKTTVIFSLGIIVLCGALFVVLFFTRSLVKDYGTIKRYVRLFDNSLNVKTMEGNLKELTETPHYTGTAGSKEVGEKLYKKLLGYYGMEEKHTNPDYKPNPVVQIYNETYKVLLPFPEAGSSLTCTDGTTTETASLFETPINPTTKDENPNYRSWIAYSKSGTASGKLIYVNYGRKEDFDKVVARGINLNGKVVIVRYGKIFRGQKVKLAQEHGCVGVILYSDPADDGADVGTVYPGGLWRPETSLQRGSSMFLAQQPGDPTTPGFPSLPNTRNRISRDAATNLPTIPVTAINAKDALNFLKHLDGVAVVDEDWKGGLKADGFEYRYGTDQNPFTTSLDIKATERLEDIHNIFVKITGKVEPDRLVMLGNHRDAWVYGATDPHSGTVVLLETARIFGQLLKNGWQPRRSILLALWDAEEPGLIGSTEFVEQYRENLRQQMVAYVNVDSYHGDLFRGVGSQSLGALLREVTEQVANPNGNGTVLKAWEGSVPAQKEEEKQPVLPDLVGSGSDYTAFYHHVGIPILDLSFRLSNGKTHGAYHSIIDNFDYFTKYIDPVDKGLKVAEALVKITGRVLFKLADDVVLHFAVDEQAKAIKKQVDDLKPLLPSDSEVSAVYNILERAASAYVKAGGQVKPVYEELRRLDEQSLNYETKIRTYNDKVTFAERGFVSSGGLPGRSWYRHVISAPGKDLGYGYEIFPAVREALRANNTQLIVDALEKLADAIDSSTSFVTGTFTERNTVSQ